MKKKNVKEIKLGDLVRDTITGFEGIAVAKTDWLNGCSRFSLQSTGLHEGKVLDAECFDEMQLELVGSKGHKPDESTGGPRPDPAKGRRECPRR